MSIVKVSDFVGFHNVVKIDNADIIQAYIDRYEKKYLAKLMGIVQRDLLIADLDLITGLPESEKYTYIFGEFDVHDCCCDRILMSSGLKDMLLGFIYFQFVSDGMVQISELGGVIVQKAENASIGSLPPSQTYKRYNESVESAKAIQYRFSDGTFEYADYHTSKFLYSSGL